MSDALHRRRVNNVIKLMVAVTEHIRDCPRCRFVFGATFEAMIEARQEHIHGFWPNPWVASMLTGIARM